jgi:hypothetical protein
MENDNDAANRGQIHHCRLIGKLRKRRISVRLLYCRNKEETERGGARVFRL